MDPPMSAPPGGRASAMEMDVDGFDFLVRHSIPFLIDLSIQCFIYLFMLLLLLFIFFEIIF